MNEKLTWNDYDSLFAQTEAVANAVNDEFRVRIDRREDFVVIDNRTASDLMWGVVDNLRRLREIESALHQQEYAERKGVQS